MRLDLQPCWQCLQPDGSHGPALNHPWAEGHRPDWHARGLIVWPRGGQWHRLQLRLTCPEAWRHLHQPRQGVLARLVLRWWAEAAEVWVDGELVEAGDLFDTACRWRLPAHWWSGAALALEVRMRSPKHDDGALIQSRLELEPLDPADSLGVLEPQKLELLALRRAAGVPLQPASGDGFHVLGHAHLDLAWLWPVADTWQAAERTFATALDLMERFAGLHFAHSTPALYAWMEQHRPALWRRLLAAVAAGRFEPINGPWVENDCVLISTASLLRQFQLGQRDSHARFPALRHHLAWLPDSFGFAAGVPAVASATQVQWFCTHKLFWNSSNPFPHRLFRWRSRCGAEVLALMTAPIGTDGDPVAMERERLAWQRHTGLSEVLWLPGVGDHGGGPTAAMLEQLELWQQQPQAASQKHGSLRDYLASLEPQGGQLPVWRDELYLELHRGCATTRPDQKRHNRSLERLLREAELAVVLAAGADLAPQLLNGWQTLLFQQFHDILPGTAIPEVFDQAESQWCGARRQARRLRDEALRSWLQAAPPAGAASSQVSSHSHPQGDLWWLAQLQPLQPWPRTLRLPAGSWQAQGLGLPSQPATAGGDWVQLPPLAGVCALALRRCRHAMAGAPPITPIEGPVWVEGDQAGNGLLSVTLGPRGLEQLWDGQGSPTLAAPLAWRRFRDEGEFWDAWDIAADYRHHPLPWHWHGRPHWQERGPLCARFVWNGHCGSSTMRLDGRLLAGTPWLELSLQVNWRQRHELLRLELPLQQHADRWATDTSGGVLERPAEPLTPREQARWEVSAISWVASCSQGGGLAALLDGPQGVSGGADHLGISLLRAPTWPDPGADNGQVRQRVALLPCPSGWRAAEVPDRAVAFREPLWLRPVAGGGGPPHASTARGLPPLPAGVQLVGLRPLENGAAVISLSNLTPCRQRVALGSQWTLEARLDGLDAPRPGSSNDAAIRLAPWQLGFWRLRPR